MKCSVDYAENTFGNSVDNAGQYTVALTRLKGRKVRVSFVYKRPASGRGVGPYRGKVLGVSLILPARTARALTHALELALSETANASLDFRINENSGK